MFTNSSGDPMWDILCSPELLQSVPLIHRFFPRRSMAVEEFIIQDKSICFSATSPAILLIRRQLCILIGPPSSVVLAALARSSLMTQRLILHPPVVPFNYWLSSGSINNNRARMERSFADEKINSIGHSILHVVGWGELAESSSR